MRPLDAFERVRRAVVPFERVGKERAQVAEVDGARGEGLGIRIQPILHIVAVDFMDTPLSVRPVEPIEDELVVVERRRSPPGLRLYVEDFRHQLEHRLLAALGLGVLDEVFRRFDETGPVGQEKPPSLNGLDAQLVVNGECCGPLVGLCRALLLGVGVGLQPRLEELPDPPPREPPDVHAKADRAASVLASGHSWPFGLLGRSLW